MCDDIDVTQGPKDRVLWVALPATMAAGPMFLYLLAAISPKFIADLELSHTQYGSITLIVFGSAAVSSFLLSGASSRVGGRTVLGVVAIGGIASVGVLAVAESYGVVVLAALIGGVTQAVSNPITNRIVAEVSPRMRGPLIGWKQAGVQMAQLLSSLLAPTLALLLGWRETMLIGVFVGLLALTASMLCRPFPPYDRNERRSAGGLTALTLKLTGYSFFLGLGLQGTNAYLTLYAFERLGFELPKAAFVSAVVGCVGLISRVVGGRLNSRVSISHSNRRLAYLSAAAATGVIVIALAEHGVGGLIWLGSALFGAAALGSNSVAMATLVNHTKTAVVGSATGTMMTGMYAGFGIGPVLFGAFLDFGPGYALAWLVPIIAFGAATAIALFPALNIRNSTKRKATIHAHP